MVWSFGPIFAALFLYLAMRPPVDFYPRVTMLLSLMLAGIFALVPFALGAFLRKAAVPALVLVIVVCVLPSVTQSAERNNERRIVRTNAYNLMARFYRNRLQEDETGGGIARFRDRYLLATGDGSLYVFEWNSKTQDLELQKSPYRCRSIARTLFVTLRAHRLPAASFAARTFWWTTRETASDCSQRTTTGTATSAA